IFDAVSWSANTLTLNAGYNINVGSSAKTGSLTVSGTGALALNPSSALVTGYTSGGMVLMGMAGTPTGGPSGNGFNGSINLSATDATRLIASSVSPVLKISGNNYTVIKTLGSASDYSTSSNNYTLQGMAASNNVGTGYWALGNDIDASALESLEAIASRLNTSGIALHFSEIKGPVMDKLERSEFFQHLQGKVFLTSYQAIQALTPEVIEGTPS
ncbi:MAG: sodium-independent anion transporter, partial [Betaproteobacteria bacterium]|nr:sodium-independent anion transporter [Betaproteobacteria bacterium]